MVANNGLARWRLVAHATSASISSVAVPLFTVLFELLALLTALRPMFSFHKPLAAVVNLLH
jgi:hypothetical protein